MLCDVRGRQRDAEGEVDNEDVFEKRPLANPDQGLGTIHVEIPVEMRIQLRHATELNPNPALQMV